jgi:hypothetical protein
MSAVADLVYGRKLSYSARMRVWDRNQLIGLVAALATVAGVGLALLSYLRSEHIVVHAVVDQSSSTVAATTSSSSPPAPSTPVSLTALPANEATHTFPGPLIGVVWVKVVRDPETPAGVHVVTFTWGAKHRSQQITLTKRPVFMTMHKTGTDETPLAVTVQPGALIGFGDGTHPHGSTIAIDAGWSG